jgi:hypothetical protein
LGVHSIYSWLGAAHPQQRPNANKSLHTPTFPYFTHSRAEVAPWRPGPDDAKDGGQRLGRHRSKRTRGLGSEFREADARRAAAALAAAAAVAATSVNFSLVLSVTDPHRLYQAVSNLSAAAKAGTYTHARTHARMDARAHASPRTRARALIHAHTHTLSHTQSPYKALADTFLRI